MLKCIINNQPVQVPQGSSIIEAFKRQGVEIAHYCWHPGLSVAGVCRLCMVDIEGIPKLQIACNTMVKEGMKISNQSEKVRQAVKWGLEFHLINHPLDCPICDQAGECELQEQYMRFGRYRPSMAEHKVKKRKVVDLGSKVVLDTERCILCTRCVRFTDEVSKTHELGIFNRGDRSEIGVFKDKPLENNYSLNTVDICPVGALTSREFRFQQRVWYLKTAPSVCTGCATGCSTFVDYNEEGVFRVRPRYNGQVNKHWMCDEGRGLYALPNKEGRLKRVEVSGLINEVSLDPGNPGGEGVSREESTIVPQRNTQQTLSFTENPSFPGKRESIPPNQQHSAGSSGADILKAPPLSLDIRESTRALEATCQALNHLRTHFVLTQTGKNKMEGSPPSQSQKVIQVTHKKAATTHALVLTAQYTLEEYEDIVCFFLNCLGVRESVYYWKNKPESFNDFDGLLCRGDKNPNTFGLLQVLGEKGLKGNNENGDHQTSSLSDKKQGLKQEDLFWKKRWHQLESRLKNREIHTVWVAGPENQAAYPDLKDKLKFLTTYCKHLIWWTAHPLPKKEAWIPHPKGMTEASVGRTKASAGRTEASAGRAKASAKSGALQDCVLWQIPAKTFFEKEGTYLNYRGLAQKTHPVKVMVPAALSLSESVQILKGQKPDLRPAFLKEDMKTNHFTSQKRAL